MKTTEAPRFGELLRRHRLTAGLTQEALAERAELSVRAITDLERGARSTPYRDTVRVLADALALQVGDRAAFEAAAHRPRRRAVHAAVSAFACAELPAPLTPLLDREQQVAEAVRLLRRTDVRLVTLTGAGGIGKTRLALQVAAETRDDYVDGIAFVSLGAVADPELVLPAVARAVGLGESAGQPLAARLAGYLRDKHLLLILDNVEHLLPAAPAMANLLRGCPRLVVLATSRAALRLNGEHELPVPPLPVPVRGQPVSVAEARRYAAVELFCRCAAAIDPSFALTAANTASVVEIVQRLDGLPLAIELAAARIKVLAPDAMLARLTGANGGASLQLLTGGPCDLPARQRTWRGAIAWSHELLTPAEQALFRRLAVFAGGCTLAAATAVAGPVLSEGAEHTERRAADAGLDVLDVLASLVNQSLLTQRRAESADAERAEAEPRFVMLETVREYGLEQLRASGELASVQRRHATYYLALAEAAQPRLEGPEQREWLQQLECDHGNLRAALGWAVESDAETALRLAGALWYFWELHGHWSEGCSWLERALSVRAGTSAAVQGNALVAAGILNRCRGNYTEAEALFTESRTIRRALDDQRGIAESLRLLGDIAHYRGDFEQARALYGQSLTIRRELGDRGAVAWSLGALGDVAMRQGDYVAARNFYQEGLAIRREVGGDAHTAWLLRHLGLFAGMDGDAAGARALLDESGALFSALGDRRGLAWSLCALGDVVRSEDDAATAGALFAESLAHFRDLGEPEGVAMALVGLAALAGAQGRPQRAARLYGAVECIVETLDSRLPAFYREDFERGVAAVRSLLDRRTFAAAWASGRLLSLETVIAEALSGNDADGWITDGLPRDTRDLSFIPHSSSIRNGLTAREAEVLAPLATGLSNREIAEHLVLSVRTVGRHVENIYGKLDVHERSGARQYAREHGLLGPASNHAGRPPLR